MKKVAFLISLCVLCVFVLFQESLSVEIRRNQSKDAAVLLSVKVSENPPKIILNWTKHPLAYLYEVRRKNFEDISFPATPLAVLDSNTTSYEDANVVVGKEYEYEVRAYYKALIDATIQRPDGSTVDTTLLTFLVGFGYVHSGINVPPRHYYGRVLVLVDETIQLELAPEIDQYIADLVSEGWTVTVKYVPRVEQFDGNKVKQMKDLILEEYGKDPVNFSTVVLLGRVAVPYSGLIAPDGHSNHVGAWPCDMYYGSIYETFWTDFSVNNTSASDPRNHNIPGDGKFDQNTPGSEISFAVGRIDFYNMPKFTQGEIALLRQYLNKNHLYRTGQIAPKWRGLIDDNFGANRYINSFASSGYRNFASLLGPDNIVVADWFTTLKTDDYLWAYGCGGGTFTSAGGIGSTDDFVANNVNAVFTMLFGSYFGDWDSQNNFMRASLASKPSILTCSWAGFPHWYFHNMSANLPIGYSTKITQSNVTNYLGALYSFDSTRYYIVGQGLNQIHVALMGDPTLTLYSSAVPMPKSVSVVQPAGEFVHISWQPASEPVDGYFVYRSLSPNGDFVLLNPTPTKETSFVDSTLHEGTVYYMVRSFKVVENNSGTFGMLSRGAIQSAQITSVADNETNLSFDISPNPFDNDINLKIYLPTSDFVKIALYDFMGRELKSIINSHLASGEHNISFNFENLPVVSNNGIFFVKLFHSRGVETRKIVKIKKQ